MYTHQKAADIKPFDKVGITLQVYRNAANFGFVHATTKVGHNEKFYHKTSTFTYYVISGSGNFFLNDEKVPVSKGDLLSIEPNTSIYYKGELELLLITTPPWTEENEVATKSPIW